MKTVNLLKKGAAVLLSALLMMTLFAIPAFADEATTTESKGLSTTAISWIVVGAVVLVAGTVLCIVFREKLKKGLRVYKSEVKKVVWLPWEQTRKNTVVVIIILVICAAAICLLDFGLSKGILAFINLF